MKLYKNILVLFVAAFSFYSCSSNFNGFYRQTVDNKHKACITKNKEKIEAMVTQCNNDGQQNCYQKAVTWVCEDKWRNY